MTPAEFEEANVVFAKDQPEYQPLPAFKDEQGNVITCWKLTEEEKQRVLETGEVWVSVMTFNRPLQPMYIAGKKEDVLISKKEDDTNTNNGE